MGANTELLQGSSIPLYQFLTDDGSPTGDKNMTGNYSPASPGEFFIKPPSDEAYILLDFVLHLRTTGKLNAGKYDGNITLSEGIQIVLSKGSDLSTNILVDFLAGETIKANGDWGMVTANIVPTDFGTGDNFLSVEVRLSSPVVIDGKEDHLFGLILKDDFSAASLVKHTAFVTVTKVKK